jgi:hypothetical protein
MTGGGGLRGYQSGRPFQTVYDPWESRGTGKLFLLFGYKVNKLHHKIQQGRCGKSLHPLKEKAS